MFSRMRPYELYFWQPTGLKSMRDGYRCIIRNRSRATGTGAGAGVACHVRSNAVC